MKRFGIDVSNNQGEIEWHEVAPHVAFVFVKTSEGMTFWDPNWGKARVDSLRRNGITFGPYHFASNEGASGKAECDQFLHIALGAGWGKKGDLPGVLDIEHGNGGHPGVKFVREFARQYRKRTGHRLIVYTGSFWRDVLRNPMILTRCKLFLAAYTPTWHGFVPRAWKKPWIWQYGDQGSVPGINGNVDQDRFLKSKRAFERMKLKEPIHS
jgi:lysozyme